MRASYLALLLFLAATNAFSQEAEKALAEAAASGDLDRIDSLTGAGANINHIGDWGLTALQMAQVKGRKEAV